MKIIRILLPLILCLGLAVKVQAAESTRIQAILITASNREGKTDPRLAAYEPTLKRILRFQSYRYVGQGSANLTHSGTGNIALGNGQHLEVTPNEGGRGMSVRVVWKDGGRTLMETGLSLNPGVPAVLGGPGTGNNGEVYAIILVGR